MSDADLIKVFRNKLQALAKEGKYARQFTPEEIERVCRAFVMALENPAIPETLLFEFITGEKG